MPKSRAVAKAAADAEKLHAEIYGPKPDEPSGEPSTLESVPSAAPEPPEPQAATDEPTPTTAPPPEPQGAAPEAVQETPKQETPKQEESVDYWKNRFQTMEGKYNSEVPRMAAELRIMQSKLAAAETQNKPQTVQTFVNQPQGKPLVTKEEIDEYGEDTVDFFNRLIRQNVAPLEEKFSHRVDSIEEQSFKSARDEVFATLYQQVPEWEQINTDDDFVHRWLSEPDMYAGRPRGELLHEAFEANDANRVLAFFKGYLREKGAVEQAQPAPDPAPAARQPAVNMESLVAPGKPRGGTASTQEGETGRVWRESEIRQFYQDVHKGVYRNDPARKEAIERDLIAATTTPGRVVPG